MANSGTLPTLNDIKGLKNNLKIAVIQPSHKNHKNVENFDDFFRRNRKIDPQKRKHSNRNQDKPTRKNSEENLIQID